MILIPNRTVPNRQQPDNLTLLQQLLWQQQQQDYFNNRRRHFDSYEESVDVVCTDRQLEAYDLETMNSKERWEQEPTTNSKIA